MSTMTKGRVALVSVPWARIVSFSLSPALAALSPLLILPVIAHALGVEGWGAIAIGQSVGMAGALVVAWGWNVTGATEIASAAFERRGQIYSQSLAIRAIMFVGVSALCVLIVNTVVRNEFTLAATIMAVSLAFSGMSPSWFYVGSGEPLKLVFFDAVPKILAAVLAVPFVLYMKSAIAYPLLLGILVGLALAASTVEIRRSYGSRRPSVMSSLSGMRAHAPIASSQLLATIYTSFSVTLVSIGASSNVVVVASFAAGLKIMNLFQAALATVMSAFQGWVGERWSTTARQAVRIATTTTLALSLAISAIVAVWLPDISSVLFGRDVEVDSLSSVLLAMAFLSYSLTASGALFILIPGGKSNVIAVATGCASAVGLPSILGFSSIWGVRGACAAILLSELTVLCIELPTIVRAHRVLRAEAP